MNRERAEELLPILQAFIDGKEIRRKHGINWINDHDEIHLDQEYRIEPRVFWVKPGPDEIKDYWLTQGEYDSGNWNTEGFIKTIEELSDE